jgi:DNA adenine methylase
MNQPLVTYFGGKQKIAQYIVKEIENIQHNTYHEPFCGGAAVFFAKSERIYKNSGNYREILNDTSDNLINLYRTAKTYPEQFIQMVEATLYSQSDHCKANNILKEPVSYSNIDRAWAYYISANCSFGSKVGSTWNAPKKEKNVAKGFQNRKLRLREQLRRLESAYISCEDALTAIARWDSPTTLFYCDPPYIGSSLGHYNGYTESDYQALVDLLDAIKGSYILSNYPQSIKPRSATSKVEINTSLCVKKSTDDIERKEILWIKNASGDLSLPLFTLSA